MTKTKAKPKPAKPVPPESIIFTGWNLETIKSLVHPQTCEFRMRGLLSYLLIGGWLEVTPGQTIQKDSTDKLRVFNA